MDRAWENLLLRTSGSLALGFLLIHAGQDVGNRSWFVAYLAFFAVLSVVANWALARLNVKRPALWATTIALGLFPAIMPLLHLAEVNAQDGLYRSVLYLASAFGLVTAGLGSNALVSRAPGRTATRNTAPDDAADTP